MVRLLSWMPRGRALPPEVWAARHRGLLLVLLVHLVLLPAFAITQGWSFGAAWAFDALPAQDPARDPGDRDVLGR